MKERFENIISLLPAPYYKDDWCAIYHGDCREILPLLPDKSIDLVLTDPPYGINANKMQLGTGNHSFHRGSDWDAQRPVQTIRFLLDMGVLFCLWGGNYFADILPANNKWLIWHKMNDGLSFSEAELAWTNYANNTRVYSHYVANQQKVHPTQKPLDVMRWAILQSDNANLILDPFLGSGTTIRAALDLNRYCIGIEIEEKYCEIAAKRCSQQVMELSC